MGILAQWLAWRFHVPAVMLLIVAGIISGPGFGWLNPAADFGVLLQPIISIAVCLILFEGGLHLDLKGIKQESSRALKRLILVGLPLCGLLNAIAAHYLLDFSWKIALLFAGVILVTGPTVIILMIKQSRLIASVSSILKWEGILNDPIGSLLAILLFETLILLKGLNNVEEIIPSFLLGITVAAALSFFTAKALERAFYHGHIPEFLKPPTTLLCALICFTLANSIQYKSGLLSVILLGMILTNSKIENLDELRRFKEYITALLISGEFVIIIASLEFAQIRAVFNTEALIFILISIFALRPVSVFIATGGLALDWKTRLMLAWSAPKGVVVIALVGYFAEPLYNAGYEDAANMIPLAMAMVFSSALIHGFSMPILARMLGLTAGFQKGFIINGASCWSINLAKALKKLGLPVLLTDTSWHRLNEAKTGKLPTYYGELLSEEAEESIDLNAFGYLFAATDADGYNSLVCMQFAHEFGRNRVYQIWSVLHHHAERKALRHSLRGRLFGRESWDFERFLRLYHEGWEFRIIPIKSRKDYQNKISRIQADVLPLLYLSNSGILHVNTPGEPFLPEPDSKLIIFCPADTLKNIYQSPEKVDFNPQIQ
jgi:NhaP-type Na+/H+ or K+/H+ antiporter